MASTPACCARTGGASLAPARNQRDRCDCAHQPWACTAECGCACSGGGDFSRPTAISNMALKAGTRGSRHDHAKERLCRITGAEDALVVNNNAGAVFLVLAGSVRGRGCACESRPACRNRRRLSHSGCAASERSAAGRGGHYESHASARLRRRHVGEYRRRHAHSQQQFSPDRICYTAGAGGTAPTSHTGTNARMASTSC